MGHHKRVTISELEREELFSRAALKGYNNNMLVSFALHSSMEKDISALCINISVLAVGKLHRY